MNDFIELHFTLLDKTHLLTGVKKTDWICSFNLKVQNEYRTPLLKESAVYGTKEKLSALYVAK
jgi:hypothetical protein